MACLLKVFYLRNPILSYILSQIDERDYPPCDTDLYPG